MRASLKCPRLLRLTVSGIYPADCQESGSHTDGDLGMSVEFLDVASFGLPMSQPSCARNWRSWKDARRQRPSLAYAAAQGRPRLGRHA
jgi:hypothetical protein